jgi:hypothetical protein
VSDNVWYVSLYFFPNLISEAQSTIINMKDSKGKPIPGCANLKEIRKIYPNTLFVVDRSIDNRVLVYEYHRKKDTIENVTVKQVLLDNLRHVEEMSSQIYRLLYEPTITRIDTHNGKCQYFLKVACLKYANDEIKSRPIELHMKKKGKVIATVGMGRNGKQHTILKIHADIELPYKVNAFWLVGEKKKKKTKAVAATKEAIAEEEKEEEEKDNPNTQQQRQRFDRRESILI